MEHLVNMILSSYSNDESYKKNYYYAIQDNRKYPHNLMIFVPDVAAYVYDNGGLEEFDYEI